MADFVTQVFFDTQVVNEDNMNGTFENPSQSLSAYFPINPAIASGIGTMNNKFGQVGTTNVFNFTAGFFRFVDQVGPLGSFAYPTWTQNAAQASFAITATSGSMVQLYIVADLTQTAIDSAQFSNSSAISATAIPLSSVTDAQLVICAITNTAGVYVVSLDVNCAHNYNLQDPTIAFPDITDNTATHTVSITGAGGLAVTNSQTVGGDIAITGQMTCATGFVDSGRILNAKLVQCGIVTTSGTSTPTRVTLATAMPTNLFSIVATNTSSTGTSTEIFGASVVSTSQFDIRAVDAGGSYIVTTAFWIVMWRGL